MISTVTTSTISTITTVAMTGSLAIIAILLLITLLVQKELVSTSKSAGPRKLSQVLNLSIAPLLLVFVITVAIKVIEVLQ
jgi:hypothetical protein